MSLRRRNMMQSGRIYGDEYIQDGLVFHLDARNFNGGDWVDRIGGVSFKLNGQTKKNGGVYNAKGDGAMESISLLPFYQGTHYVEMCFVHQGGVSNWNIFFSCGHENNRKSVANYRPSSYFCTYSPTINNAKYVVQTTTSMVFCSMSENETSIFFNNQEKSLIQGRFGVGGSQNHATIFGRDVTLDRSPIGYIFNIRVYDRPPTQEERFHNYQQDVLLFGKPFGVHL